MGKSDLLTYFLEFNMISEILVLVTISNRIFYWTIISVLRKYVRGIRKFGAKHFSAGVTIFLRNALVGAKTTGWQKPGQTSLIHPMNITNFQILQYSKAIPLPPTEHIFTHRLQHENRPFGPLIDWPLTTKQSDKQSFHHNSIRNGYFCNYQHCTFVWTANEP